MNVSDVWGRRVRDVADLVLATAAGREPTLGRGRLVCLDGPAGSGKSTLGQEVARAAAECGSALLVHADDLLDGWHGLPRLGERIEEDLLVPLGRGESGHVRRHDWTTGTQRPREPVVPVDLLCLEGVGSWAERYADRVTLLVWVELPEGLRRHRALLRDGDLDWWEAWAADERRLHAQEHTPDRADVVVSGDEHELTVVLR